MVYNLPKISSVESFWGLEMFKYFIEDPDLEHLILDTTMVRAHSCAAGKKGDKPWGEAEGDTAPRFMRV